MGKGASKLNIQRVKKREKEIQYLLYLQNEQDTFEKQFSDNRETGEITKIELRLKLRGKNKV